MSMVDVLTYIAIGLVAVYLGNVVGFSMLKERLPNCQFPDGLLFLLPLLQIWADFYCLLMVCKSKDKEERKSYFSNLPYKNVVFLTVFSEAYQEVQQESAEESADAYQSSSKGRLIQGGRNLKVAFSAIGILMVSGIAS